MPFQADSFHRDSYLFLCSLEIKSAHIQRIIRIEGLPTLSVFLTPMTSLSTIDILRSHEDRHPKKPVNPILHTWIEDSSFTCDGS